MSNLVEIIITAKNLAKPAFDSVAADSKVLSSTMGKMGLGAAAALVGIGVASVKMASTFQQQVTRLGTQAGVSKQTMGELQKGVLDLAGQVGFSPLSLAKSAYYVESNFSSMGISTKQALELVKIAAQGAAVGGSDLVDTTTALNATVASGIPGVQDYSKAMGALNAIVGTGEMTMSDLVKALGTGVLAVVKGYGLSITDVGAALTTFGDNNIRGAVAATDLRMAVQSLAVPAKGAATYLKEFGWTAKTMQTDMQNHGLVYVLDELHAKFVAAGISAKEQGGVITEMFGKKAGAGLAVLLGNMDRIDSKVPALQGAMNSFAGAWAQQKQTFSQQMKDINAGFDAVMIKLGLFLMPKVSEFITMVQSKGSPAVHDFAKALSEIGSGFSLKAATPVADASGKGHSHLDLSTPAAPNLTMWQKVGQVLKGVAGDFGQFAGQVVHSLANLWSAAQPAVALIGGEFLLALKATGALLAGVVGPALVAFTGFLKEHKGILEGVVVGYTAFKTVQLAMWTGNLLLQGAIKGVVIATKLWTAAQWLLDYALNANPVGLFVIAVAALSGAFYLLYNHSEAVRASIATFTSNQASAFGVAAHGIVVAVKAIVDVFMAMASDVVHTVDIAFGWVPGIGGKVHAAAKSFDDFKKTVDNSMNSAITSTKNFTAAADKATQLKVLQIQIGGWNKNIEDAKAKLASVPASKRADLLANITDLENKVKSAQYTIDSLQGRTVTIEYHGIATGVTSSPTGSFAPITRLAYAHGGAVSSAATGGARSGMVWVGEQGPELVKLPTGSTVTPAGQSKGWWMDALNDAKEQAHKRTAAHHGHHTKHHAKHHPGHHAVTHHGHHATHHKHHPVHHPAPPTYSTGGAYSTTTGGGMEVLKVQLEWVGAHSSDKFLNWLREAIRIRGGNVQTVLGH